MERREFVGAVVALFAGVAMPEPVREAIRIKPPWPSWDDDTEAILFGGARGGGKRDAYIATFSHYYQLQAIRPNRDRLLAVIADPQPFFDLS